MLTLGQSTIDIQFHDTYLVINKVSLALLILGPLTFLIFIVRALAKKFRSIGSNVGLIVGLILICLITYAIIEIQQGYLSEIKGFSEEGTSDTAGGFYRDTRTRINLTWGLFALWVTGLVILSVRTIRLWRERHRHSGQR